MNRAGRLVLLPISTEIFFLFLLFFSLPTPGLVQPFFVTCFPSFFILKAPLLTYLLETKTLKLRIDGQDGFSRKMMRCSFFLLLINFCQLLKDRIWDMISCLCTNKLEEKEREKEKKRKRKKILPRNKTHALVVVSRLQKWK